MAFRKTANLVLTKLCQDAMLASAGAAEPDFTWVGAKVQLFSSAISPTRSTLIGAITECDFTGYAEKTLDEIDGEGADPLNGPLLIDGDTTGLEASLLWTASGTPDQTIQGVAITNPAGTALWAVEQFSQPVPISAAGQFLQYDLILPQKTTISVAA